MRSILVAAGAALLLASAANAAPACRDKGKFVKCPAPAAAPTKAARCKDAKGKFAKCTVPGAKPV